MMAQTEQQRRPSKPGDWHTYLMDGYSNCVNALRIQNAESTSIQGIGPRFNSFPSIALFEGCVDILEAMCTGYSITDADYESEIKKLTKSNGNGFKKIITENGYILRPNKSISFDKFAALTALLKRKNQFVEKGENLGHV